VQVLLVLLLEPLGTPGRAAATVLGLQEQQVGSVCG